MNWWLIFVVGAVPLITGWIWYSKKMFGNAWMKATGFDPATAKPVNMALVFGLTYLFGVMLTSQLMGIVIHQMGVYSIVADTPDAITNPESPFNTYINAYGHNFRTFKHGVFHGVLSSIFFVMPIISIIALYERKGAKYIFVHVGYWALTLGLMGGILCQWL